MGAMDLHKIAACFFCPSGCLCISINDIADLTYIQRSWLLIDCWIGYGGGSNRLHASNFG